MLSLLSSIAPKYSIIGTLLNVPINTLGLIALPQFHCNNLSAVLQYWIENGDSPTMNSPVTWKAIIKIIEGDTVSEYQTAQKMRNFLCEKENYKYYMEQVHNIQYNTVCSYIVLYNYRNVLQ